MSVYNAEYTYDRSSNRLTQNLIGPTGWDREYTYDDLNRLTQSRRGKFNGGSLDDYRWKYEWTLDAVGNWKNYDAYEGDGDTTFTSEMSQVRGSKKINEIDTITNTTPPTPAGTPWPVPTYQNNGNTTQFVKVDADPKDVALSAEFKAVYDGWNRIVKITETDDTVVATYQYDGRGFRIMKKVGTGTERHSYYNSQWQLLEDRLNDSPNAADPERIYVWGMRYIDDLILRKRDSNSNGTLDETLYALQDVHFNVIALWNPDHGADGDIVERYDYNAYGDGWVLAKNYSTKSGNDSDYDWTIRYADYRHDSETRMYYVRNRTYHPVLGAWLQRDPLGYVDGMNLYEYVRGRPVVGIDMYGTYIKIPNLQERDRQLRLLNQLCPQGNFDSNNSGYVFSRINGFCNTTVIYYLKEDESCATYPEPVSEANDFRRFIYKAEYIAPGFTRSRHIMSCSCICALINRDRGVLLANLTKPNLNELNQDVPFEFQELGDNRLMPGGFTYIGPVADVVLTGERLSAFGRSVPGRSLNDPNRKGRLENPDYIILGHELCGHALTGFNHPEDNPYGPNDKALQIENAIRREHSNKDYDLGVREGDTVKGVPNIR